MKTSTKFQFLSLCLFLLLIVPAGIHLVFAEKTVSIQKTVDVDKTSLIDSLSDLGQYSRILPDYIQSSKLTEDNTGNLKIGLDWISINTDLKFTESDDKVTLEVISGDFKGTKLYITMAEKSVSDEIQNTTSVSAELSLQRSWHMEILTSFVSDDDIESMLYTSLNGLEKHAKNPQPHEKIIKEKEPFCIFGLCF